MSAQLNLAALRLPAWATATAQPDGSIAIRLDLPAADAAFAAEPAWTVLRWISRPTGTMPYAVGSVPFTEAEARRLSAACPPERGQLQELIRWEDIPSAPLWYEHGQPGVRWPAPAALVLRRLDRAFPALWAAGYLRRGGSDGLAERVTMLAPDHLVIASPGAP